MLDLRPAEPAETPRIKPMARGEEVIQIAELVAGEALADSTTMSDITLVECGRLRWLR